MKDEIIAGKKSGIIPILMYFEQEALIANITLSINIRYFRIKTNFLLKHLIFLDLSYL
jgi:hypothetical protein